LIDFLPFLKIFPVLLFALMSPGPSFVMISNLSLARGRSAGIECAAGLGTGDFIYAALSLLGLDFILTEIPEVMIAIRILGGLYLIYIGIAILRSTFRKKPETPSPSPDMPEKSRNAYLLGLLTGLTNPKVIIFYGSLLSVAMGAGSSAATKMAMAPFCGIICFAWYGFVAKILSVPKFRAQYQAWGQIIDRASGTILCLFGIALILSGKS
jgi:threonine efflux protein